jgi:transcriptional regulator
MYTPAKFQVDEPSAIHAFIRKHSFGLLLTVSGQEIEDTHTPFLLSESDGCLVGHVARANPQWKSWNKSTRAKVIFTGPHAYVSPGYYVSEFNVPTWNYTAVSVSGALTVIEDEAEVVGFLDDLTAHHETGDAPWKLDRKDDRYMKLLSGIVVFRVAMESVEASFKLNQNKAEEDQRGVIGALKGTSCPSEGAVAELMEGNLQDEHSS